MLRRYSKLQSVTPTLEKALALSRAVTIEPDSEPSPEVRVAHRLTQRLSTKIVSQMIFVYQSGATAEEVAQEFSVSKGSAVRILTEYGVMRRRSPTTEEQIQQAAGLYARGMSLQAAGQQVGLSATALCRAFRDRGIPTRRPWERG